MKLKEALTEMKLAMSYGEIRMAIGSNQIKINGELAIDAEQEVKAGDVLLIGKKKSGTVV